MGFQSFLGLFKPASFAFILLSEDLKISFQGFQATNEPFFRSFEDPISVWDKIDISEHLFDYHPTFLDIYHCGDLKLSFCI